MKERELNEETTMTENEKKNERKSITVRRVKLKRKVNGKIEGGFEGRRMYWEKEEWKRNMRKTNESKISMVRNREE